MNFIILVLWLALALITGGFASARGRNRLGWIALGILLGPLALLAVVLAPAAPTPNTHFRCPDCLELVLKEARVCRYCGCRLRPNQ
jgi:hypothetical protein